MTGYIWECERCLGSGKVFIVPYPYNPNLKPNQQACGLLNKWINCFDCHGSGIWELK